MPRAATSPTPQARRRRGRRRGRAPGLSRVTPHELRHSYAAMMIAAGVNAKALQTFMGHTQITVTYDRYGHLMPGSEAQAAALAGAYMDAQRERAEQTARGAGAELTGAHTGAQLGRGD